ncbi:ribosome maturation factor RimM [Corynebacterium striatum]|uniref:ribosome maturation factor RimM n=1 Tax=Corynebacterium striatum TaxID=43770 RepID=UPI000C44B748|nr:ribosome maturation factor RimM [Corynebacterium striatum]PIS66781.1 ribosome maturation factor RimM [Corynebacterium striatum]PXY12979.1 ribosome maturation factor RimM [Corynebacterium striatum]PXY15425.1 ribosome maturation factor RimM [Corynebacterium striatum]
MELMIGRVIKSHGIKGELSVEVTTDEPEIRFAVGEVLHGRQGKKEHELTIKAVRVHKGRLLITFEEVKDRTAADSLRGTQFFAPPLDDPDDDGFYDHELEGLRVIHDGNDIGEVTGLTHGPTQSLLEVRLESGKEALIPFVEEIVPEVDLDEGTCTITPPEGLLDL